MDRILYDALERLLAEQCTPQVVRDIESGASVDKLWQQLGESGFTDAMVDENSGGAGLSFGDAFDLLFLCGRYALPVPLAQTVVVRGMLARQGIDLPEGRIVISALPVSHSDELIECRGVPFGKMAQWVVVPHTGPTDQQRDLLLPAAAAQCTQTGVHGSLQAHLSWKLPLDSAIVLEPGVGWLDLAAALTAAEMAGAMQTIQDITVRYAGERSQFGRPIAKFQAVQQQLSVLAELVAASRIGAELGCHETDAATPNLLAAAVAKARASEAAGTIVSIAHAVHAAMGITEEYDLQLYTRRLIEWRTAYGSAGYWNRRVGDAVLSSNEKTTLQLMLSAFFSHGARQ